MRTRRKTPVMTINVNGLDLMLSPRWDKKPPQNSEFSRVPSPRDTCIRKRLKKFEGKVFSVFFKQL